MNNPTLQCKELEANLERLHERMPEMPTGCVMVSRLLLHIGRGMSTMLEHKIRPFGLNEAEFRVLTTLFSQLEGVANPTDLCSKTSQSPANMSRISDALVGRDLITREPSLHDRRKMVLRITERGEQLVRQLLPMLWAPLRDTFENFSEEQLATLVGQLKDLAQKLDDDLVRHEAERGE